MEESLVSSKNIQDLFNSILELTKDMEAMHGIDIETSMDEQDATQPSTTTLNDYNKMGFEVMDKHYKTIDDSLSEGSWTVSDLSGNVSPNLSKRDVVQSLTTTVNNNPSLWVRGVVMDDDGNIEKIVLRAIYKSFLPQIKENLGVFGKHCQIYETMNNGTTEWEMEISGDQLIQILFNFSLYGHLRP